MIQLYMQEVEELSYNVSPNIVTMVNTIEGYGKWEQISGEGRIIPAFPGFSKNLKCHIR